ncbi:MAG: redoxin domain-containing protein [Bacteroidales bacterium]|nr:redoxin domain-containing protein [Bacteroidales bacterium]
MKKTIILLFVAILSHSLFAQNNHEIVIKIKSYPEKSLLLTSYFGDKIRIVDTARVKSPGVFVFEGKEALPGGIYMAVSPAKRKLFEFIINKQQHFTLSTDTTNYAMDMEVENSLENQLFFQYMKYNEKQYRASLAIDKERDKVKKGTDAYKKYTREMDSLRSLSGMFRDQIIQEHPNTFVATIFRAMSETEKENTEPPKTKEAFLQMRKHYWDHFALNDPRLFRTPLYAKKIDTYFQNFVPMQPDSVDQSIDNVISRARSCSECVSFLVWKFTMDYQNPKYMGFDKVFVHLVDDYFEKEHIQNTTPSIIKLLKKRADALRPLLLGKRAPELVLMDTTGKYVGFESLPNRYTLLLFWDYKCGVCKQEMKQLVPFYNKYAKTYDLAVYGININPDLENWKKAVRERKLPWINVNGTRSIKGDYTKTYDIHGTPQFFLLDRNKKIIAKQFSVDQLKMILDDFVKRTNSQKK